MSIQRLQDALATFDRAALAPHLKAAATERAEFLARFPATVWPTMPLERYALGTKDSEESFCRWLEFRTPHCGSIRGNTSRKFLIYAKQDGAGYWHSPDLGASAQEAWEQVRGGFERLVAQAAAGGWDTLDDQVSALWSAPMARLKLLHFYFPEEVLPVFSQAHLLHFLRLVERPEGDDRRRWDVIRLNRLILATLREKLPLGGWSTTEIERFLYLTADPRQEPRVVKIAPGEGARYWDDCRQGGYICVGWDDLGDLGQYEAFEDFLEAFKARYGERYKTSTKTKAKEIWTLRELEPGDRVVANQGTGKVVGVGTVGERGYYFNQARAEYRHCVAVTWDESAARSIPAQPRWGLVTIADVAPALWRTISTGAPLVEPGPVTAAPPGPTEPLVPPPDLSTLERIAGALQRKKQLILYGPPGTGKTYTARRFALRWLLEGQGRDHVAAVLASPEMSRQAERQLSAGTSGSPVGSLTWLTFHASYSYEDFVEGYRPAPGAKDGLVLALQDGVFKRICKAAAVRPDQRFLVIIDEINRANLAKVFGELITLLEADKRGLEVELPQSKERFSIPENVYLLGTMNTADRSIKLFDLALRRRFAFVEVMPDVGPLDGAAIGTLALDAFLEALNRRIADREGREKQIGQAALLDARGKPVASAEEFAARFTHEILPLLQEYCFEDWSTLSAYVGTRLVDAESRTLNEDLLAKPDELVKALAKELTPGEESAG